MKNILKKYKNWIIAAIGLYIIVGGSVDLLLKGGSMARLFLGKGKTYNPDGYQYLSISAIAILTGSLLLTFGIGRILADENKDRANEN